MATVINGRELSERFGEELKHVIELNPDIGRCPKLCVVLVGNRPDSASYVRMKKQFAKKIGVDCDVYSYPDTVTTEYLSSDISYLSTFSNIDGIIIQLPLPPHLDKDHLISLIPPSKDVDGLTLPNLGALVSSSEKDEVLKACSPCTPDAVIAILDSIGFRLEGSHVVLIGSGELVGRPLSLQLLKLNATVTSCNKQTKNIENVCQLGDVVVVACGVPGLVKKNWIKPGAVVIDVGISSVIDENTGKRKLVGDVDPSVSDVASFITPVPGGVGPMTVAMLLKSVVKNWLRSKRV